MWPVGFGQHGHLTPELFMWHKSRLRIFLWVSQEYPGNTACYVMFSLFTAIQECVGFLKTLWE